MKKVALSYGWALVMCSGCVLWTETRPSQNYCTNQDGDAWCQEKHGVAMFCVAYAEGCDPPEPDGCSPTPPSEARCHSPCGIACGTSSDTTSSSGASEATTSSGTSTDVDTTSETTSSDASESTDEGSSTGPVGCTEHEDCIRASEPACGAAGVCVACDEVEDGDAACATYSHDSPLCRQSQCVPCDDESAEACPAETPACAEHRCVECTIDDTSACPAEAPACSDTYLCVACTAENQGACADTPDSPVCFDDACVACTAEDPGACGGTTPVCDVETNTCVPCTEHSQCGPSGVCRPDGTGECIPQGDVRIVDGSAGSCGTQHTGPLCTIRDALALAPEGGFVALLIYENDANRPYLVENLTVDDARSVMFVAAEGEAPIIQGNAGPGLTVTGGSTAWLEGIEIAGARNGPGLLVTGEGSRAELEDCRIANNSGGGISVTNGAAVELDRCHVVNNGQGAGISTSNGAVDVVNSFVSGNTDGVALSITSSLVSVLYSTVGGNLGAADALRCNEGSTVSVRNSLLLSRGNPNAIDCLGATIEYSGITGTFAGTGNVENIEVSLDWVPRYNEGDFHLVDGHPADDIALWQEGDPTVDIDGDSRNVSENAMGVAGADLP